MKAHLEESDNELINRALYLLYKFNNMINLCSVSENRSETKCERWLFTLLLRTGDMMNLPRGMLQYLKKQKDSFDTSGNMEKECFKLLLETMTIVLI